MNSPQITIVGRLWEQPELAFSKAGKPWLKCQVICKDKVKDANGAWVDADPVWFTILCWGDMAEHLAESVRKGDDIIAVGAYTQREYEIDGVKRHADEIKATSIGVSVQWGPAYTRKALEDVPVPVPALVDVPLPDF